MSQEEIGREPMGRRGLCSAVHDDKLYLIGGYPFFPFGIDVYDFYNCEWTRLATDKPDHPLLMTSGSCCVVIKNSLYVFGGWSNGIRNADVHELNLKNGAWRQLKATNPQACPMWKDKAGMVDYGEEMLCVMGGYGVPGDVGTYQKGASYHWDTNVNCWTNELHLFHITLSQWISPETTGQRPAPCAAFSFTRVDRHRVVLFGGRQAEGRVDQLHILDMQTWNWSGAILPAGPWPQKRSFHSACSLPDPNFLSNSHHHHHPCSARKSHPWLPCFTPDLSVAEDRRLGLDPKLLVLWGMDNDAEPVNDAWILNVTTLTWEKVPIPESAGPARIWFTMSVYHPTPHQAVMLVLGGSNRNLFKTMDHLVENVHEAAIMHFGMAASLYDLCLRYLVEHVQEFTSHMVQLLPAPMQAAVQQRHQQLCNQHKLFTYKCSL